MTRRTQAPRRPEVTHSLRSAPRRWLLFVHQLPPNPSKLRVRTWRRLQQLGAIPVKQAVYVLPDTPATREDFEWLRAEVQAGGGEASVFAADTVDAWSEGALVAEFRRSRQAGYAALAKDMERVLARLAAARRPHRANAPPRRSSVGRVLNTFRDRLAVLERIDFFGGPGRDSVVSLLTQLEGRTADTRATSPRRQAPGPRARAYQGKVWITRPRPGVDRMASAWLIRRSIDPRARFGFAQDPDALPTGAVPFDMFGVGFSHQGDLCTFETLCAAFGIDEPAIARLAAIVHDLDLKDARFGAPDAPTVATVIEGLQLASANDGALLEEGITFFDALYRGFVNSAPSADRRAPKRRPERRSPRARSGRRTSAR